VEELVVYGKNNKETSKDPTIEESSRKEIIKKKNMSINNF
jgi:hypothetical protein